MKLPSPSSRDGRAIIIGSAAIALAACVRFGGIPYVNSLNAVRSELATQERLLRREVTLLGDARAFPDTFRTVAAELFSYAPHLLPAEEAPTTSAALQRYIREAASGIPMTITSMQPAALEESDDGVRRMGLRVEGETDLEGFLALVAALEAGTYLFHLHDLSVRASHRAGSAADRDSAETLRFTFVAVAFSLEMPEAPQPAPTEADADQRGAGEGPRRTVSPSVPTVGGAL